MEEVLIGAISAFTLAIFGAGGVGIWAKKRNGGNGGGEHIRLLRSIDNTLQGMHTNQEMVKTTLTSMDTNIDGLRVDFARLEGRLSN